VYRNQDSPAYDAAIVDGIHDISNVLARITEFIINRLRKIHMQWVYQSRIDPLDWPARCLIAKILTNQWAPYLPPMIRSCEPAHLADAIPHLLKLISSNHIIINKRMATGIDFSDPPEMDKPILPLFQIEERKSDVLDGERIFYFAKGWVQKMDHRTERNTGEKITIFRSLFRALATRTGHTTSRPVEPDR